MSGKRFEILTTGEVYHLFNRSIDKKKILTKKRLLTHFLNITDYYRYPQKLRFSYFSRLSRELKEEYENKYKAKQPLVSLYSFSFMPNHFHFLLKQEAENGIKDFISNIQNSFAKYFNLLEARNGPLFTKPFKAKRLESDEEFLHISRYIHLNHVTSFLFEYKDLTQYPWTSYPYYITDKSSDLVDTRLILNLIGSKEKYEEFVRNQVDYQRKLGIIKHLLLE